MMIWRGFMKLWSAHLLQEDWFTQPEIQITSNTPLKLSQESHLYNIDPPQTLQVAYKWLRRSLFTFTEGERQPGGASKHTAAKTL